MAARSRQFLLVVAAFAAAAILANVALLEFYVTNAHALEGPTRLVQYAGSAIAIVALSAALLKLLLPKLALWRILLAVGIAALVFCSYHEIKALQKALTFDGAGWLAPAWIAVTIAAGLLALVSFRRPAAVSVILILSIAYVAPSTVQAIALLAKSQGSKGSSYKLASADHTRISPNIYWIVLD